MAATEDAIDNTSYAGAIFDEPEIYIALGEAACARFSAGESFAQIASDMLADLGSDDSADDERLVGAIIGAASRTICPEHADKI